MSEYKFDMPSYKKHGLILEDADEFNLVNIHKNHEVIAKDSGLGLVLHRDSRRKIKGNTFERWLNSVNFI